MAKNDTNPQMRFKEFEDMSSVKNGSDEVDVEIEQIASEQQDRESSPPSYEILSYPADYTLEVLADKWRKKTIELPGFQRRFVWTMAQASKLIDSFLLGLPVPPIFLYSQPNNKLLVVDGQQRMKSIIYFFEGYFGEEVAGRRPVFRLTGLNEKSKYANKTYADLRDSDDDSFRRLNDAVLRSIVIKQLNPQDHTSIYHIFERLNTGGTSLTGQEIRNCIYHGKLNDLLITLNKLQSWREIIGKKPLDKRQRDIELILRFFALKDWSAKYERPMKDFLNKYMDEHKNPAAQALNAYEDIFTRTVDTVRKHLGETPFHIRAGLNIAAYDSVFTAFASHLDDVPADVEDKYKKLLEDETFIDYTTSRTTNEEIVAKRREMVGKRLFGE